MATRLASPRGERSYRGSLRPIHSMMAVRSAAWGERPLAYAAMAREDQLAWPTLDDVTEAVQAFLESAGVRPLM